MDDDEADYAQCLGVGSVQNHGGRPTKKKSRPIGFIHFPVAKPKKPPQNVKRKARDRRVRSKAR